ncbi:MAG: hypothetical protein M3R70_04780 [Actinomycetota bacterium]|nr:hypothetical protein [Actinomycetota bacterium]
MKGKFSKGVVIGALVATLVLAASAATAATGGNFILGMLNTASSPTRLTNTSTTSGQIGLDVIGNSATGSGIRGQNTKNAPGVSGLSASGIGVFGKVNSASSLFAGVEGDSPSTAGGAVAVLGRLLSSTPGAGSAAVRGQNSGTNGNGSGVAGVHAGSGIGVFGDSASGIGSFGRSKNADGYGGWFQNATTGTGSAGIGLVALGRGHTLTDTGIGPDGFDGAIEAAGPNGVEGNSNAPGGFGVSGDGPAVGVNGTATSVNGQGGNFTGGTSGIGVNANGGTTGVSAAGGTSGVSATGDSVGVDSAVTAGNAVGVRSTAGSSANDAVQGNTSNGVGDALQGFTTGGAAFGVFAVTEQGAGVVSSTNGGTGVSSSSSGGIGVSASNNSATNPTVNASNGMGGGTAGRFTGGTALNVENNGSFGIGLNATVTGDTNGDGDATNDGNDAIFASSDDTNNDAVITANTAVGSTELSHEAIETSGFLDVNGNARVTGTLTKGAGAFEIDHPQDPQHYYLRHSFVESPDMKNVYDGVVTTGKKGKATVKLPTYFGALNRSFRYQLTVIGADFAQAIVSKEIAPGGHTFKIRTNKPNVKVSWQVTGIRKDAYANAHRIKVVERKTGKAANMFLHPELFGRAGMRPLGLDLAKPRINTLAADRAQAKQLALVQRKAAQARKEAAQHRHATAPPKVQQQR